MIFNLYQQLSGWFINLLNHRQTRLNRLQAFAILLWEEEEREREKRNNFSFSLSLILHIFILINIIRWCIFFLSIYILIENSDDYEPKSKMSKSGVAKEDISLDNLIQTYTQFQSILNSPGNEKLLTCLVMAFVRDNEADIQQCIKKLEVGKLNLSSSSFYSNC